MQEAKTEDSHPDMMTLEQLEGIRSEIAAEQPMIGSLEPLTCLIPTYENSPSVGFVSGINFLNEKYRGMRRIRGDGNCFYRGLLYGYLSSLLRSLKSDSNVVKVQAEAEYDRIFEKIKSSLNDLVSVGYSEFTIEIFYDELVEILQSLKDQSDDSLLAMFQQGGKADYVTWYMRALTAGYLKRDPDRFLPFVEGAYVDIDSFCTGEVEPMDKECEHLQIIALTEYLGIKINIAYLDGRPFDINQGISILTFPESLSGEKENLFGVELLYRPGHYDVLYSY